MTNAQRTIISQVIARADRGPSLRGLMMGADQEAIQEAERACRVWANSWIADQLRAILANDAGELSASMLLHDYDSPVS